MFKVEDVTAFVKSKSAAHSGSSHKKSADARHVRRVQISSRRKQGEVSKPKPSFMMPTLSSLVKAEGSDVDQEHVAGSLPAHAPESFVPNGSESNLLRSAIGAFSSIQTASPEFVNKYSLHSPGVSSRRGSLSETIELPSSNFAKTCEPIRLESNLPAYDAQALYNIVIVPENEPAVEFHKPLPPSEPRPAGARRVGGAPGAEPEAHKTQPQAELRRYEVDQVEFSVFTDKPEGETPTLLPITAGSISEAAEQVLRASQLKAPRRSSLLPPTGIHGVGGQAALQDLRREMQAQADKVLHLQTRIAAEKLKEQLALETHNSDETGKNILGYKNSFLVETSAGLTPRSGADFPHNAGNLGSLQSPESRTAQKMLSSVGKALEAIEKGPIKRLQLANDTNDEFASFMEDVHGFGLEGRSGDESTTWSSHMAGSSSDKPWTNKHASIGAMVAAVQRFSSAPKTVQPDQASADEVLQRNSSAKMSSSTRPEVSHQHRFESPIQQSKEHDRAVEFVRKTARDALTAALNSTNATWNASGTSAAGHPPVSTPTHPASAQHSSQSPPRPKSSTEQQMPTSSARPAPPRKSHPPPSAVLSPEAWTQ